MRSRFLFVLAVLLGSGTGCGGCVKDDAPPPLPTPNVAEPLIDASSVGKVTKPSTIRFDHMRKPESDASNQPVTAPK